jgi:uracil-DNA glycosylase
MKVNIDPSWQAHLQEEFEKPYFSELATFVRQAYTQRLVYPSAKEVFSAFSLCKFEDIKVVILGQDPYHGPKQAHGLCFSVRPEVAIPPSLVNIFQEIKDDVGSPIPTHGDLSRWAKQGVLLLNATLTVYAGQPGSHQQKGWETFTDAVIALVSATKDHVVFILWGKYAQQKVHLIDGSKHLILQSAHPSPYAAAKGFFGSKPFSKANEYLKKHGLAPIVW